MSEQHHIFESVARKPPEPEEKKCDYTKCLAGHELREYNVDGHPLGILRCSAVSGGGAGDPNAGFIPHLRAWCCKPAMAQYLKRKIKGGEQFPSCDPKMREHTHNFRELNRPRWMTWK